MDDDYVFDDEYDEFLSDESFLIDYKEIENNDSENDSDSEESNSDDNDFENSSSLSLDESEIEEHELSDSDNMTIQKKEESKQNKIKPFIKNNYTGCPYLTKFEKVRVLGTRSEQIAAGSKIFVQTNKTDPFEIALEELYAKKMPLLIRRYTNFVNNKNNYVDISVNSLIII